MTDYWVRRFELPNIALEGWAVVIIDSKGYLGIISDWGGWIYHWTSFGEDFREFLLDLDTGYLSKKLSGGKMEYDGAATLREVKTEILNLRREAGRTKDFARTEWCLLEGLNNLSDSSDFSRWLEETRLEEASEFACKRPPYDIMNFLTRTWPRFIALLRTNPSGVVVREKAL